MTVEDDRIEHAARAAWETFSTEVGHDSELWRHQNTERQERWRKIARAVLQYVEPTEEIKRLESQLAGLRRAYDHERLQAEKYMRRAIEWRDAALNGTAVTVACTGCGSCDYCAEFPRGLCGNRDDHAPHLHDSAGLGRFWCDADQSKRLPFAMERQPNHNGK